MKIHSVICGVLFVLLTAVSSCGPPEKKSNQEFWNEDEDSAWQEHLNNKVSKRDKGEQLFIEHCAMCHFPDKDMTGPALRGSQDRWKENSSNENFYAAIQNFEAVVESGDQYAIKLKKDWGAVMTPIDLTRPEIDTIYDWIEGYVPPVITDD